MNTPEAITARKMSVYWLVMLLSNGIDVYPVLGKKGRVVKRISAVYPWLLCSFWLMVTLTSAMSLVYDNYNFDQTIVTVAYATGAGCTLVQLAISLHKRPAMYEMLAIVQNEFWHDGDRRPAADQLFSRFVRTCGVVFPVANFMMCMAPLVWMFQHDGDVESPNGYIYHLYTPWKPTVARYFAVYFVQLFVSISINVNLACLVLSMVVFVNEMQVQMDILVDMVHELDAEDLYSDGKLDPDRTRRSYDSLVKCIKHHQTLIKYFNHFKSYFNILFGFENVYIIIVTCLSAGSILFAKGIHINVTALLIIVVSQYLFYCLIGEQFAWMNSQLEDCVYFKCLKCKSPKLVKLGLLMVLRSQKPLQLTAMGISKYTASLSTFMVTMKTAYVGLNVLRNTLK